MKPTRVLLLDINRVSLDTSKDMLEYPLGLLYVGSALKRAFGEQIELRIESYHDEPRNWPQVEEVLASWTPQVLGLRGLTMGRRTLHRIGTLARDRFAVPFIIAGGPHATHAPGDVLANPAFDCAVLGEGEETAVDLVGRYLAGASTDTVPGIARRTPDGLRINPVRAPLTDLDRLPLPDHHLMDFRTVNRGYVDFSFRMDVPHANLFTSRGCPYQCIYCHKVFGKTFRAHSPERILTEIRTLHDEFGIRRFQILDDIWNIDRRRALRTCELIVRSGLDIEIAFPNALRGDLVDEELVDAMWSAGVRYTAYAIESASPRIQKLIRKNLNLDRVARAISLSTARGITTRGFFMLGFPTETEEEARLTVEFAKTSDLVQALFFTVVCFPGTPLFDLARELCDLSEFDLAIEDDYVHTREGPYAFSRATLDQIKLEAVRGFFFSDRRLKLAFDVMPGFYSQRDIDAAMLANIISAQVQEGDLRGSAHAERLHRYFLVKDRFSEKSGFFV
jgi:anaerobic magnesium-protoporphyrin IX monomethyl ester cyclase